MVWVTSNEICPAHWAKLVLPSNKETMPPSGDCLYTSSEFDRSKHPSRSDMLFPTWAPLNPDSYETAQMRQLPRPAPSRSKGGVAGVAIMLLASSVIINPDELPEDGALKTISRGSGLPSTQITVRSSPEANDIAPPSTSQVSSDSPASVEVHIEDVPRLYAASLWSERSLLSDCPVDIASALSPFDQSPADTATASLVPPPLLPHIT